MDVGTARRLPARLAGDIWMVLSRPGRLVAASPQFEEALRLKPDIPAARQALAGLRRAGAR